MMIATIDVMPAPPTPDTILPMMICGSELAVPLVDIRLKFLIGEIKSMNLA